MTIPTDNLQNASDFDALAALIEVANKHFEAQVSRAVNVSITLRSWVTVQPRLVIRDPYMFEFMGLKPQ